MNRVFKCISHKESLSSMSQTAALWQRRPSHRILSMSTPWIYGGHGGLQFLVFSHYLLGPFFFLVQTHTLVIVSWRTVTPPAPSRPSHHPTTANLEETEEDDGVSMSCRCGEEETILTLVSFSVAPSPRLATSVDSANERKASPASFELVSTSQTSTTHRP